MGEECQNFLGPLQSDSIFLDDLGILLAFLNLNSRDVDSNIHTEKYIFLSLLFSVHFLHSQFHFSRLHKHALLM